MTLHSFFRLAVVAGLVSCSTLANAATTTIPGRRYGNVTVTQPVGPLRGFVVLYSQASGWSVADQQSAEALAKAGALTVGVDTARYAANLATDLAQKKETCNQLVGDAEALSHQLERQSQSSHYFAPIVAGTGQGATLAMQVLEQAPSNTIAGAVSVDAEPTLDRRFRPCPPDATIIRDKIPGFVEKASTGNADRARLVTLIAPHLQTISAHDDDVSDLPLIELPAAHPNGLMAIVISGDGGWRDLDKTIAQALQKDGVSVIGWDSLRYFWSEKPPAQTSRDLARVMQTYGARWHAQHVALIGYSFGADVMPFAYNRLPDALRAKVSLISLLGFAPDADFQIRVGGWLGMPASDKALKVRPELTRVPPAIVQCIYGADEEDTLCPALTKTGIEVIRTSGDHHFGGDYNALERRILAAFRKQSGVQD
ncbi:MAG: Alanylphosphatidylglycerol hydrolase, periplasmic [uncultured Paraburkholderia sp.]|uniref:virulence factor family protein n=1 Tax=uncultured Paraburkholderia sp. TaxID=1822466 RepID=UPI002597AA7B|nr:AcvB/VirJ family lysyl-phosphatidylglycerol hydrolase [uncultured Paraburkholderia sp.]CAH2898085.1 MAG: Alanylphosphatidylglycerol hydrolase, periplasmic [uncultured Paraburkholderia sp.]CAH2917456.1 MAG: Alanylphosphatidylglycerol hydrolase, periplasmic [uncultured Paraburkholderia sp.]